MKPVTVLGLMAQVHEKEEELRKLKNEMNRLPYSRSIQEISMASPFDFGLKDEANQLVDCILARDFPMTRAEVTKVFASSGFKWNRSHIDACKPDTEEQAKRYLDEIEADRRSVYG